MADDKVLINFRISKDRKKQLEYLAEKIGVSITQYLDQSISVAIKDVLYEEGDNAAFEQAAIKAGISPFIAKMIAENRVTPDQYKDVLKEKLYEGIYKEYEDTVHSFINARWKEFGIAKELPAASKNTDEEIEKDTKIENVARKFHKASIKRTLWEIKQEGKK
jgi:predicted transcriptional regulator